MIRRRILPFLAVAALAGGCDGKAKAPAPTPDAAKAESKAPAAPKGDAKAMEAKANPHGATDKGPHGGPAGMPPKKAEPGPPRDVKPSGEVTQETLAEIKVSLPKEWEKGQAAGPMRMAQYVIPGPGGDAELVVYRFKGGAGGVDANVARWKSQFQPPEGKSIDDATTVKNSKVGDLAVTNVDIRGRYVAAVRPGSPEKVDNPEYRMIAAIVEGSGDPFFFKATGPSKTLEVWGESWDKMLGSFEK